MSWAITAMVAAAALTAYNQKETARKQDRAVSKGILERMNATRDQSTAIQKALADMRGSNAKEAVAQRQGDYLKELSTARPMGSQPAQVGAASDAYREAAGAADAASTAQADKTAGLMAVTDAPGIQRQGEGVRIGQLSALLGQMGIGARDASNQAMMKAQGIRPNPWIGLAAAALSAYGSGRAGSTGATSSSSSVQSPSSTGYYQGGSFAGGGNYTGPGSTSTDYTSNVRNLYGVG